LIYLRANSKTSGMRLFGMDFKTRLSRRNFISLSSLGMALGFTDAAHKNQTNLIQSPDNHESGSKSRESNPVRNRVIQLHSDDNVAVALEDLPQGARVTLNNQLFILEEFVAAKHKFTLTDIPAGGTIFLYGIKVGTALKAVSKGTSITTENTINAIAEIKRDIPRNFKWTPPSVEAFRNKSFMGYHRPDGQVGTANYWLVIPMVFCENRNVEVIKEAVLSELGYQQVSPYQQFTRGMISMYQNGTPSNEIIETDPKNNQPGAGKKKLFKNVTGIRFLVHSGGCGESRQDSEELCGLLAGYITHPNVAGATVLSLGCQNAQLTILQKEIRMRDPDFSKPYFEFEQQKTGTEDELIKQAIRSIFDGLSKADQIERKPASLSKLSIGVECGGSDGFSGISANPAVGHVSDLLVALGGSVILSEFPELSGVFLYN
jgi:altronate hydrolase